MWASFKYSLLQMVRVPGMLIWTLIFPIVLGSLFIVMLGSLDDYHEGSLSINVVVVDDAPSAESSPNTEDGLKAQVFNSFIESMSEGDDALFDVTYAATPEEAARLVRDSIGSDHEYAGYVHYADGHVNTMLAKATDPGESYEIEPSVLMLAMDRYTAEEAMIQDILRADPAVFSDPAFLASLSAPIETTVRADITANQPRESLRYYFALLGMAAFFGANIGLVGFQQIRANASALAARRSLGTLSHGKTAFVTLMACWLLAFASLVLLFFYLIIIGGVDFGDRSGICLLICLVASLCSTAFGCVIAAIPKIPDQAKGGLLCGLVCIASIFAGLYGSPSMQFADAVSASAPWLDMINPTVQVCQAFYATMFYDTNAQTFMHLAILLAMALVFFALSARSLRRQRYASL